ncbi:MAG: ABC transporter substrate-binding protein [Anaerolineae bacterium]
MMIRKLLTAVFAAAVVAGVVAPAARAQNTPAEIKVWIAFTDARLDWSRARAEEFNAQFPQYKVTVDGYANYEEIQQATDLAIQQGSAPAVVQWFEVGTQRARDFGYFTSIADALGDRTEVNGVPVNFDDFIKPVVDYYTIDGKFTSMPWNSSSPTLYSNTAMLAELGLDAPPATWQELEAACAIAMEKKDALKLDGCVTWPNHGWFFEQWMAQQDALMANNGNGRDARATEVLFNSAEGVAIYTWWQNMHKMGYYVYSGQQRDWGATELAITSGKVPFIITSSADTANITNAAKANGIDLVTSRMPYNADKAWTGNLIGGASLWLVKDLAPEVQEGALTFLLWFTNTENIAGWHKATGYLPLRNSSVELLESEGWFNENPNFLTAVNQIRDTTVTPATRGALLGTFPETRNILTRVMEELMLQGGDVTEALNAAKAEADKLLEEYNALYVK